MEAIKGPLYTVREVPANVTPERLVEIFAIAIKERNYALYLDCIDPERKKTERAEQRIRFHWEIHQRRFAELYCHATIEEERTRIDVISGTGNEVADEDFFLTEEEKKDIQKRADPLVEQAVVWTRAWNERGAQVGKPKPHHLRRYEKKQWFIHLYSDQF